MTLADDRPCPCGVAHTEAEHSYDPDDEDAPTYRIERCFFDRPGEREVITTGLTLEEAQEHCNDDSTSGDGWFDAYYPED